MDPLPAPVATSARTPWLTLSLAIVGAVLLVITIRRVGWAAVQSSLASVGWWFASVVALGGLRFATRARAWMACADEEGNPLRFRDAFSAMLAGDALGNLTPLGPLASEPAKVLLVKHRLTTVAAVSSVAAENAFYTTSVLVVIAAGAIAFFGLADLPAALRVAAQLVLAGVVLTMLIGLWAARRQPAILSRLARMVASLSGRGGSVLGRLLEIERRFYALLGWPAGRLLRIAFWEASFHVTAVAEVFVVVRLLPGGHDATVLSAFVLETAGRLITVVFKFVPYRLGVDEAGTALIARALSLDPAVGVTLALIRRLRILFWNAVGLLILAARR